MCHAQHIFLVEATPKVLWCALMLFIIFVKDSRVWVKGQRTEPTPYNNALTSEANTGHLHKRLNIRSNGNRRGFPSGGELPYKCDHTLNQWLLIYLSVVDILQHTQTLPIVEVPEFERPVLSPREEPTPTPIKRHGCDLVLTVAV